MLGLKDMLKTAIWHKSLLAKHTMFILPNIWVDSCTTDLTWFALKYYCQLKILDIIKIQILKISSGFVFSVYF